ncbi:B3/B4 domain-containing protein [Tabrizicola flagellatus]|uniref:B3/B4 domain-containing protein n=1 Tax=Tabrizicola flagellatus TaxID=2593021 RepID=UPI00190F9020|nr:phenylalanine--tRNA ligase beta subunit-related protein [Tabrizicola flagellatus]
MTARFAHDPALLARFPALRVAVLVAEGLDRLAPAALDPAPFADRARARLARAPEGEWPEIRAWRAAYAAMGLKPTQVRCASEALLRRLRLEGALPRVGPLVDLCNAVSAAFGLPLAVFDFDRIAGDLTVTFAAGDEPFVTFGGAEERPAPGEVIFRDGAGLAHARRWAHRQGAVAAVTAGTRRALLVAEALHDGAETDLAAMAAALATGLTAAGGRVREAAVWEAGG